MQLIQCSLVQMLRKKGFHEHPHFPGQNWLLNRPCAVQVSFLYHFRFFQCIYLRFSQRQAKLVDVLCMYVYYVAVEQLMQMP